MDRYSPTETLPGPTPLDRVFFLGAMGDTSARRALASEEREVDTGVENQGLVGLPPKSRRITSVMRK